MSKLHWRQRALPMALLALAAAACSVPKAPISVAVNHFPADVLYGGALTAISAPGVLAPVFFPPHPPSASPAPLVAVPVAPPAKVFATVGCAKLDPLTPSLLAVGAEIRVAPVSASYPFRTEATSSGAANAEPSGHFDATHSIGNVTRSGLHTYYDETVRYPRSGLTQTTTFDISQPTSAELHQYSDTSPLASIEGLGITKVVTTTATTTSTQSWSPEIQILKTPSGQSLAWKVISADTASGAVETFDATISALTRVNACGKPINAWTVTIANGSILSSAGSTSFSATYEIAPQYGAILVGSAVNQITTDGFSTVTTHAQDTINVLPKV